MGIAIIGILFFSFNELNQDESNLINDGDKISIKGLKEEYRQGESIEFTIRAEGFNVGCEGVRVMIFNEYKTQPPLYEKEFVADCKPNSKPSITDYSFPISINQLNDGKSGKYIVFVSYYQNRGSFGSIEQSFEISSQ